jgi:diguanylate cyclase (GGDEF)-like protein/PAS domain S-box-containing protein
MKKSPEERSENKLPNNKTSRSGNPSFKKALSINKNTESKLKESEKKYRQLFELESDALFLIDNKTGEILDANKAASTLYGYSHEELLNMHNFDLSAQPEETKTAHEGIKENDIVKIPLRYHIKKDGTVFPVEINATILTWNNRPAHIPAIRDITERMKLEEDIQLMIQQQEIILSAIPDIIMEVDSNKVYLWANPAGIDFFGKDVIGKEASFYFEGEQDVYREVQPLFNGVENVIYVEDWQRRIDGEKRLLAWHCRVLKDNKGNVTGAISIAHDITSQRQAEQKLKNAQLLLKSCIESQRDMIILAIDKDYNYLFFNQVHKEGMMYAYGKEIEVGMNIFDCIIPEIDKKNSRLNFDLSLNGKSHSTIQEYGHNKRSHYETFYNPIIDENNKIIGVTAFARDVTERKKNEDEIIFLSYHDVLTGIYNRTFFEEEKKRLDTKRQLPLSVIMGDLNGLKLINDSFGHSEGDKIIREVANVLKRACRSEDIVARWGGDEFIILLPKTSTLDLEEILKRIKKECKKTIEKKIPLSISLGASTKVEMNQDIDSIIKDSESNMYKNKLVEKVNISNSIMTVLEQTLYEKNNETADHVRKIKKLALKLGKSVKLSSSQLDELSILASLHDIGKVAIPEKILMKRSRLSKKEWEIIRRHPEVGFNIAQATVQIAHVAKSILSCNEYWDGSGYPKGLKGESVPVTSRIILIAAAYEVMTDGRIYKKPMSKIKAIGELKKCAGTQFDPVLVNKFIEIILKKKK